MTGSNDQAVFTWLDSMDNPIPSEMINTTDSVSTLVFSPLAASHAGNYTCVVSLEGVSYNETMMITVNGMCLTVILVLYYYSCAYSCCCCFAQRNIKIMEGCNTDSSNCHILWSHFYQYSCSLISSHHGPCIIE